MFEKDDHSVNVKRRAFLVTSASAAAGLVLWSMRKPRLVEATNAPVTIQVLASYTASGTKPYTLGTYVPGNPNARSELFFTPSSEYQSTYVQPQGTTTFNPGSSPFGFYFVITAEGLNACVTVLYWNPCCISQNGATRTPCQARNIAHVARSQALPSTFLMSSHSQRITPYASWTTYLRHRI